MGVKMGSNRTVRPGFVLGQGLAFDHLQYDYLGVLQPKWCQKLSGRIFNATPRFTLVSVAR